MTIQVARTGWRSQLRFLAVSSVVVGVTACADAPMSPTSDSFRISPGEASFARASQVSVCHRTGSGTYELLTINGNALAAHEAHGDAAPGAAVPGAPGATFDADCVPRTAEGVTGTYNLQTVNGQPLPALGNDEILHSMTIVLEDGGACSLSGMIQPEQEDENGEVISIVFASCSYTLDGTELTLELVDERDEEGSMTAELSDGRIIIHDEVAGEIVFVKE